MSSPDQGERSTTFGSLTLAESSAHIADTERHSGGASAAAICAAHAAATGQLVAQLNARRKKNPERAQLSRQNASDLAQDRIAFFELADRDAAILTELMHAHSIRRNSQTDHQRYLHELDRAAMSSIALAESIHALLLKLSGEAERTPLFLVSDIGAAIAMATGALQAALFTAIANVQFLSEDISADINGEFMPRIEQLWKSSIEIKADVDSSVLSRYSVAEGVNLT